MQASSLYSSYEIVLIKKDFVFDFNSFTFFSALGRLLR